MSRPPQADLFSIAASLRKYGATYTLELPRKLMADFEAHPGFASDHTEEALLRTRLSATLRREIPDDRRRENVCATIIDDHRPTIVTTPPARPRTHDARTTTTREPNGNRRIVVVKKKLQPAALITAK
jgi:hypothetical protein